MKRILAVALSAVAFASIASAFTLIEHLVFLNGKPFAKARTINGEIAISVQELATALGGKLTLEDAGLKLRGGSLNAEVSSYTVKLGKPSAVPTDQHVPAVQHKAEVKGQSKPKALFRVNKAGQISAHVFNADGKNWVPLADVARACGGVFNSAAARTVKAGEAFQLNCPSDPSAILGGL
jgi:hypothetical protein